MRKVTDKKTNTTNTTITKTAYWLNIKSDISNVGINLAQGIKQHDVYLALIDEVGIEALNEYLADNEPHLYVVAEGVSTLPSVVKSIADKIKAKTTA